MAGVLPLRSLLLAHLLRVLVLVACVCGQLSWSPAQYCGPGKVTVPHFTKRIAALNITRDVMTRATCTWHSSASLPDQCCCTLSHEPIGRLHCLPHVVVVGAQKAGTTALFSYLLARPDFARPVLKELQHFNRFPVPSIARLLVNLNMPRQKFDLGQGAAAGAVSAVSWCNLVTCGWAVPDHSRLPAVSLVCTLKPLPRSL